ncbi:uncharacterized protein ARMOST_12505 [Armillaria ostoyae]|uniref:Uncharacterized protein n=1 Tax=Armillaria ostoyae TaxID=47428 RepID=A0A284RK54_ARMOS|nr:uncharacterized protein ARMOST_12505 [Armillaria ostoyae]
MAHQGSVYAALLDSINKSEEWRDIARAHVVYFSAGRLRRQNPGHWMNEPVPFVWLYCEQLESYARWYASLFGSQGKIKQRHQLCSIEGQIVF